MVFQPEGLALEIFQKRHAAHDKETWQEACERVATCVANAEEGSQRAFWKDVFQRALQDNLLMPGGRIWYGAGRPRGQLLNCFVIPTADSREGWGETLYDSVVISGTGGGVGLNCSPIRPKGERIRGTGGTATGAVSLMRAVNSVGEQIKAGGGRRTALMLCLSMSHGDIKEFLDAKLDLKELNNANVSVVFDDDPEDFFDLVTTSKEFTLMFQGKQVGSIPAADLWERIVRNALKGGEPGLLNGYLANRMSNIWYLERLTSTNPCITGDTLIATADGRNAVSIRQLCEEGNDVPVYSTNLDTGQVEIKIGRNPRVTGRNKEIWKLVLDDGTTLRATPNHKILTRDLRYVELKDLKPGDSIFPFNSFDSNGYRQVCGTGERMKGGARRNRRQYRLIHEFHFGAVDASEFAIHHVDFNSKNDSIGNLRVLTHDDHRNLHATKMMGAENPYHSMSNDWKRKFASHPGELNGRAIDVSNDELIEHGRTVFSSHGKITQQLWIDHAREHGLPQFLSNEHRFRTWTNFKNQVAGNHKVVSVEPAGFEDVYNITVDDNHNYHVVTSMEDDHAVTSSGICVKNCGEIWMSPYDCCCLGALVLPRFVKGSDLDWTLLGATITAGVRFLDNVLAVNTYPLPEIQAKCSELRRIGLGITGLHDMLLELGLKYNSSKGLEYVDKLMKFIKNASYEASCELAREKGSFPGFDAEKFLQSKFVKTLKPSIRELIRTTGIRNCALNTIAPTGTISVVCGCSSGIEPLFAVGYKRKYRDGEDLAEETVIHPLFQRFVREGRSTRHFQGAHELKLRDHFEMQRACQAHVDNAVSKTINVPQGTSWEELSGLYMEFLPELKGVTVYPDGSREDQPLTPIPNDEAEQHAFDSILGAAGNDNCRSGLCDV